MPVINVSLEASFNNLIKVSWISGQPEGLALAFISLLKTHSKSCSRAGTNGRGIGEGEV